MKITILAKNIKLNLALRDFVKEKINDLEKFSNLFVPDKDIGVSLGRKKAKVEARVEIGKTTRHHLKGQVFRAECQMSFPGKTIRSVALSEDLRLAITEVKDELQRQIKRYKRKISAKTKKANRATKESIRLSLSAK